jgi:hypothetical protein
MRAHELNPSHPRHVWLQRFGLRLMQLQPDIAAFTAAKQAADAFRDAASLEPEVAAERFDADERRAEEDASA